MIRRRIVIDIGELGLAGFDGLQGRAVAAAVEAELSRLVGVAPPAAHARGIARLQAASFTATPRASAACIGQQIAGRVHAALRSER